MKKLREKIVNFRNKLYQLFPKRKDAIFELMDANTASNRPVNSVVHLSKSKYFTRQYPSITDAISDGLDEARWDDIQKLVWQSTQSEHKAPYHRFVIDCTPQDRLYAKTLHDRSIVHKANPAPGNKPICAGHEYSTVAYVPPGTSAERQRWLVPLATERVPSGHKGHDVGMSQVARLVKQLDLEDSLTLSIGDSAYATESCRQQTAILKAHIHIARLRSNRNVFELLPKAATTKTRPKLYGSKMKLNNPTTYLPHDEQITIPITSKKGAPLSVIIKGWKTMGFRGSRQFKAHQHPFRLVCITVVDKHQKTAFNKPLWLAIFGEKRLTLSLAECFENYRDRYDIEHYFRFAKQRLLMDAFQTCDTQHEEHWWKLCTLSYCQLYLSRGLCRATPEVWERFLPAFKKQDQEEIVSAPFAKRGFSTLLDAIGTPAKKPVQRGHSLGRKIGQKMDKRLAKPINFKQPLVSARKNTPIYTFEKNTGEAKPQNISEVMDALNLMLQNIGVSMENFCQIVAGVT